MCKGQPVFLSEFILHPTLPPFVFAESPVEPGSGLDLFADPLSVPAVKIKRAHSRLQRESSPAAKSKERSSGY